MAKKNKRQQSIKSKLMAAICMLLVSSIMMVSSTYAWFTLSTAPEVTGINTAVGANGNLEMALVPTDGNANSITSGVGDSMASQAATVANLTWGNLVDLSDASYGLSKITLKPSRLNVTNGEDNALVIAGAPLQTPVYGTDGRVDSLERTSLTGILVNDAFAANEDAFGVRAIGTASAMSERMLDWREYRGYASTATQAARNKSKTALETNGGTLANIAIRKATNDAATFTYAEMLSLKAIVDGLNPTDGALASVEEALANYMTALGAATIADDDAYALFKTAVAAADGPDAIAALVTQNGGSLPEAVTNLIAKYNETKEDVEDASDALDTLLTGATESTTYTWSQISTIVGYLLNTETMLVNGWTVTEMKENMSSFPSKVLADGGVFITMPSGSGVYANVADMAGDFTVEINIDQISYGGTTVENVTATMMTATQINPALLDRVGTAVTAISPSTDTSGSSGDLLTDMYGYIIDLAFRTNAADSYLQLQTAPIDRIYSDNQDATTGTMGAGASMTFTASHEDFTTEDVTELMGALRVVFFDTVSNQIYGVAVLETEAADGSDATTVGADGSVTAYLRMATSFSVDVDSTSGTSTSGITLGDLSTGDSATLCALTKDTPKQISVLVYLDGDIVDNSMVANGLESMSGKLNLQFSSSATLTPMQYTPLTLPQEDAGSDTTTNGAAAATTTVAP